MAYSPADLRMVEAHIAQGERHIVRQEELITRLRERGLPTSEAERLLADFQASLRQHWQHRNEMAESIERDSKGPAV